ncbi:MAG: hypothetical protein WBN30_01375 [Polyangiales bacterium]
MNTPMPDHDELKRRTARIIAAINQLRALEGLPPIYRQALDDARYQLTRALRSSASIDVDPNEAKE